MKTYLEINEIELLISVAIYLRDKLLIMLLFRLGCRISEALSLKLDDINFEQGTITIVHLKRRMKITCAGCGAQLGLSHSFCPKCGAKITKVVKEQEHRRQRVLPVDKQTLGMLKEYIDRGGPVVRDGKRVIFGINRHRAWQIIKQCADRAGLPKLVNLETGKVHNISPHKLRDSFAIHAMKTDDSGDSMRLLQEHLGHQSFNTTAKYRKVAGEEHREWYDRLWENDKP
jgi:integrase/recombinase XerD